MLTGGSFHAKNAKFRERASKVTVCEFVMGLETLLLLSQLGFLFFLLHALKLFFWCLSKKRFSSLQSNHLYFWVPLYGTSIITKSFLSERDFQITMSYLILNSRNKTFSSTLWKFEFLLTAGQFAATLKSTQNTKRHLAIRRIRNILQSVGRNLGNLKVVLWWLDPNVKFALRLQSLKNYWTVIS